MRIMVEAELSKVKKEKEDMVRVLIYKTTNLWFIMVVSEVA